LMELVVELIEINSFLSNSPPYCTNSIMLPAQDLVLDKQFQIV